MCSSEPHEGLSSSLSGPALGTRKRSIPSTFSFDDMLEGQEIEDMKGGGEKKSLDSDDDFVIEKKKKAKNSKNKKAKGLNKSASSLTSDGSTPSRPENSQVVIEVQLKKEETCTNPKENYQCNQAVERPVIIATPEQINSRSFEQEEMMTPSSCSNPVEEEATHSSFDIVKNLVEQVVQAQSPPVLKTSEEMMMNTLPPKPSTSQVTNSSQCLSYQPDQSKVSNPQVSMGRGRGFRPANTLRPQQSRQSAPGTRPPLRPAGPRMLRPLRQINPKNTAFGGHSRVNQFASRPGGLTGVYRHPNIRSVTPIKRRSLSTPQYSSQSNPPVVELEDSPPRQDQTNSIVNKLTSLGLSVAMEKAPPTKQGWNLPPGLSITRAPSTGMDERPSTSLTRLANALLQLGETQGRTRLVQYQLTDSQVKALQALGIRESGV